MNEARKYIHLTGPYLVGNGADVGSGGEPVIPSAIQVDLPVAQYARYNAGHEPMVPIQWRGDACNLPFKDETLDWLHSSHLIEDYPDHFIPMKEWTRVLKPGGFLVIIAPDKELWAKAISNGQPPNAAHRLEPSVGDLSRHANKLGLEIIEDRRTECGDTDYSLIFIGKKL